jgi:hypothetical protein
VISSQPVDAPPGQARWRQDVGTQEQIHQRLLEMTPAISPELTASWQAAAQAAFEHKPAPIKFGPETIEAQFLVLITCRDERQQVELLKRFKGEGLECKAVLG